MSGAPISTILVTAIEDLAGLVADLPLASFRRLGELRIEAQAEAAATSAFQVAVTALAVQELQAPLERMIEGPLRDAVALRERELGGDLFHAQRALHLRRVAHGLAAVGSIPGEHLAALLYPLLKVSPARSRALLAAINARQAVHHSDRLLARHINSIEPVRRRLEIAARQADPVRALEPLLLFAAANLRLAGAAALIQNRELESSTVAPIAAAALLARAQANPAEIRSGDLKRKLVEVAALARRGLEAARSASTSDGGCASYGGTKPPPPFFAAAYLLDDACEIAGTKPSTALEQTAECAQTQADRALRLLQALADLTGADDLLVLGTTARYLAGVGRDTFRFPIAFVPSASRLLEDLEQRFRLGVAFPELWSVTKTLT